MAISIPYGKDHKSLRTPPGSAIEFLSPADIAPIADLEAAFTDACGPLSEVVSPDSTVLILVADLTRGKGTEHLLPMCVTYLTDLGVPPASIKVLVARGTHRQLSKEEKEFFKSGPLAGVRVEEHDCDNGDKLSALLLTRQGTPVRVNKALKEADVKIILSPVSFHYFAGFGGGRKLILPGCSDRQSILANHRLSLLDGKVVKLHPRCRPGVLERNPVHEDMCETIEALDGIFAINFFSDTSGEVVFVNSGDPITSHAEACERYRDVYLHEGEKPFDILILSSGGYPYDMNFLQSHKALRHAEGIVKSGGTILFFAECEEGVGSESLTAALNTAKDDYLKKAYKDYDLNNQAAVSLYELADKFEIGMVSAMNVDLLLACGIKPCVNAESFFAEALEKHGSDRVAAILHGNSLLSQSTPGGGK